MHAASLPLSERDPNVGGRTSRLSSGSGGFRPHTKHHSSKMDGLTPTGVMGMMRTTTEIGDVGSLVVPSSRGSATHQSHHQHHHHRPHTRRSGNVSRMSTGSAPSHRPSNHRPWPSVSSAGPHRSMTSNITAPPLLDPMQGMSDSPQSPSRYGVHAYLPEGSRSYSMTNSPLPPRAIVNHRSYNSLRGQEAISQRPRSPFRYPARLKRPHYQYRPSSPAMSDITAFQPSRARHGGSRLRPAHHRPAAPSGSRLVPPYSPDRNRSAPSIATAGPGGHHLSPYGRREDSPSLPDRSMLAANLYPGMMYLQPSSRPAPSHSSRSRSGPPSSEPPSSNPPTPKDAFRNVYPSVVATSTASVDFKPRATAEYYDYTEQFVEKEVVETYQELPAAPPSDGFVQRIRHLLEERAGGHAQRPSQGMTVTPRGSLGSRPGNEIVELPASPVVRHITKELVRETMVPSDTTISDSTTGIDEKLEEVIISTARIEPLIEVNPTPERESQRDDAAGPSSGTRSTRSKSTVSTNIIDFAMRQRLPTANSLASGADVILPNETPKASIETVHRSNVQTSGDKAKSLSFDSSPPEPQPLTLKPEKSSWVPKLIPSNAIARAQSVLMSNSPSSENSSRFSVPTTPTPWPSKVSSAEPHHFREASSQDTTESETVKPQAPAVNDPEPETEPTRQKEDTISQPVSALGTTEAEAIMPTSPVSPLASPTHKPTPRDSNTTTHLSELWSWRKPVPLSTPAGLQESQRKEYSGSSSPQDNTTTDLRFSAFRGAAGLLPDVKEEPSLEGSSVDLRNSKSTFYRSQVGSQRRVYEESRMSKTSTADLDSARNSVFKPSSNPLLETRAIPSLNFSSVNLFSKLNDELGIRPSSEASEADNESSTPERRPSTTIIREKYRSFFKNLDEMTGDDLQVSPQAEEQKEQEVEEPKGEKTPERSPTPKVPTFRPLSPDELMEEVARISIPSVNGLTQRLSELVPSLKQYYADSEDPVKVDEMETTIKKIRRLGKKKLDVDDDDGEDVENDGADSVKESPVLSDSEVGDDQSEGTNTFPFSTSTRPLSVPCTLPELSEFDGALSTPLRIRSFSDSGLDPVSAERAARMAKSSYRSLATVETRPWNLDTSYPWASSLPPIDIGFPTTPLQQSTPSPRPSRLRQRLSGSSDPGPSTINDTTGLDIGAISPASCDSAPADGPAAAQAILEGLPSAAMTRRGKKSIFGSISRKIGLSAHGSSAAPTPLLASRTTSALDRGVFAPSSLSFLGEETRSVDPGDRYPTSSLCPPANIHMEDVQSFFSDDSEGTIRPSRTQRGLLRKRFTSSLRARFPSAVGMHHAAKSAGRTERGASVMPGGVLSQEDLLAGVEVDDVPTEERHRRGYRRRRRATTVLVERDLPIDGHAAAMGRHEVRAKRIVDRIKVLIWKGGELLRTMSGRRKERPDGNGPHVHVQGGNLVVGGLDGLRSGSAVNVIPGEEERVTVERAAWPGDASESDVGEETMVIVTEREAEGEDELGDRTGDIGEPGGIVEETTREIEEQSHSQTESVEVVETSEVIIPEDIITQRHNMSAEIMATAMRDIQLDLKD